MKLKPHNFLHHCSVITPSVYFVLLKKGRKLRDSSLISYYAMNIAHADLVEYRPNEAQRLAWHAAPSIKDVYDLRLGNDKFWKVANLIKSFEEIKYQTMLAKPPYCNYDVVIEYAKTPELAFDKACKTLKSGLRTQEDFVHKNTNVPFGDKFSVAYGMNPVGLYIPEIRKPNKWELIFEDSNQDIQFRAMMEIELKRIIDEEYKQ